MAPKLQRKYDTTLITMDGTCAVARGQRVAFISRQGTSRGSWTVYTYRNRDKASGKLQMAFRFKEFNLILKDNNVKLESVPNFEEKSECLFEWCNVDGNSGSLQSVAKQNLYLGKEKNQLIACSDPPKAEVFEFPREKKAINHCVKK